MKPIVDELMGAFQANALGFDHLYVELGTFTQRTFRKRLESKVQGIGYSLGHHSHTQAYDQHFCRSSLHCRRIDSIQNA